MFSNASERTQNNRMGIDLLLAEFGSAKFAIFDFLPVTNDLRKLCPVFDSPS